MTEPDPTSARNDTTDEDTAEGGQLANQGPVPPEPEDVSDTGERRGDLTAQAGGPGEEDEEGETRED
jgi:hypothetical protein